MSTNSVDISISNTVVRNDKYNEKGIILNVYMKRLCNDKSLYEVEESNSDSRNASFINELNVLRRKHFNKPSIAYLNINFLRNELEFLVDIVRRNVDILLISKTKLNKSFPTK